MKKRMLKMLASMLFTSVLIVGCGDKEPAQLSGWEPVQPKEETGQDVLPDTSQGDTAPTENEPPKNEPTENLQADNIPKENIPAQAENPPANSPEKESRKDPQIQTTNADRGMMPIYRTRHAYGGILSMLAAAYELPDMEIEKQGLYDGTHSMSNNKFALADIDGDSREELIISYTTASMAGMFEVVYDYNPDTMKLTRELLDSTDMEYYNNGIVIVPASHNHTLSVDFWPYTMYRYNSRTDQYDFLASVNAWDKKYGEDQFPEDVDADGDGIIYEIHTNPDGTSTDRYDTNDFNIWVSQYMNGAQKIQLDFKPVVAENFQSFSTDHLSLLHSIADENMPAAQMDIGWLYIQKSSLEEAEQYLSGHYAVKWTKNAQFEDEHIGSCEGKEVFRLIYMDGGILNYSGNKVEDVTVFGIYPGMDENTAVTTLMSYGFYPKDNLKNYMITGDGVGNAAVSYKTAKGNITEISVSSYCSYMG